MEVGNLSIKITADTRGVDAGITKTKRALNDTASAAQGFGAKLQGTLDTVGLGGALAIGAMTTAVVKFGTDSVKAAVGFDSSMANINSILKLSQSEMDALGTKILDFGANTRAGPQATANAFYEIVSGVADASTHMAILEAATATAEAGNADLTSTTGALVSVMNSYAFEAEQAGFASDVLTRTVGAGVGSMDEFASALGMSAGLAAQSGISFDELGGSMAYLTTQGFSAAQAGTRLTAITTAFLKPNEKMKKALKAMGVESGSAGLEMYGLAGMTQLLSESMGGSTDAMSEALGTTEALTGALALNAPGFEEFIDNFKATTDGATDAAQAIQNASTQASFDRLNAQVERLQIGLGGLVAPVLEGAVNFVVQGIEAGADIIAEVTTLGTNLGKIASDALNESLGWNPTLIQMVDDDPGPIRKQMREFWAGLGNVPVDILLDPKFSFMADMADDFVSVVTTEIAGIKPIEAILSTIPKFLPPAIPNTIAAMNDLIAGIQEQGITPTQQLAIEAAAHVRFTTAMERVRNDVNNTADFTSGVGALINDGMGNFMGAPPAVEVPQTWFDQLQTNYQEALDAATAAANPLQAAFDVDATLEPKVNRTMSFPALEGEVKEYASTVLKNTTVPTPADLAVEPTVANGEQVVSTVRGQLYELNFDTPANSVMTMMALLGNGHEVQLAIKSDLLAMSYDTTITPTITVDPTIVYSNMPGGATGSGTNYDGTPDGDGYPWTPMATGGKVPYDNFAALLHKGEVVVPANYVDRMGGGGNTFIIQGGVFVSTEQEMYEIMRTAAAQAGLG